MKITDIYLKVNAAFEKIERIVAILLISSIVIIVFSGTVSRYVFNNPLFGSDRLATYLMIWLGFIGFQIATSKSRHIEVEFVKAKVSPAVKYKLNILVCFIACIFLFVFAQIGFKYVGQSMELGDVEMVLQFPMWMIIMIIPVSFIVSSLRFFFTAFLWIDVLKGRRKEEEFISKQIM